MAVITVEPEYDTQASYRCPLGCLKATYFWKEGMLLRIDFERGFESHDDGFGFIERNYIPLCHTCIGEVQKIMACKESVLGNIEDVNVCSVTEITPLGTLPEKAKESIFK